MFIRVCVCSCIRMTTLASLLILARLVNCIHYGCNARAAFWCSSSDRHVKYIACMFGWTGYSPRTSAAKSALRNGWGGDETHPLITASAIANFDTLFCFIPNMMLQVIIVRPFNIIQQYTTSVFLSYIKIMMNWSDVWRGGRGGFFGRKRIRTCQR